MPIVKTKSGRFKIRNVPGSDTKKEKMKQLKAIKASENFAEDPSKRQHTILQYERSGASELAQLLRDLDSNDSDVRADAVDGLADLGDARAVPMLFRMLKDEDFYVRNNTVQALQEFGDKRAVEPLIEALNDEKADIRLYAVRALAELEDKKAIEPLLALLKKEDVRHSENPYGRSFTGVARNPIGQEIEAALSSLGYDVPDTFAEEERDFAPPPKDPIVLRKEALDKERSARTPGVDLSYEIIKTHKTSQEEADFEKMLYDLERQFGSYSPPDQVILLNALEEKRQTQDAWDNEIQDFFRALVERDFATHEELTDVVGEEWVIKNFPESDIAKEREKEEQDLEDYEDSMRHWGLMSESEFAEMTPELAEKVRIEHEVSWEDEEDIGGYIDALVEEETDPEGRIGFVNYVYDKETNSLNIQAVEVPRAWRRQGVATAMYDKLMQEYPGANMPAGVQTSKGKSFRKAYNKRVGIRPDGTLVVRSKAQDTFAEDFKAFAEGSSSAEALNSDPTNKDLIRRFLNEDERKGGSLRDQINGLAKMNQDLAKLEQDHYVLERRVNRGGGPNYSQDYLQSKAKVENLNKKVTRLGIFLEAALKRKGVSKPNLVVDTTVWTNDDGVVFAEESREQLERKARMGDPVAQRKLNALLNRGGDNVIEELMKSIEKSHDRNEIEDLISQVAEINRKEVGNAIDRINPGSRLDFRDIEEKYPEEFKDYVINNFRQTKLNKMELLYALRNRFKKDKDKEILGFLEGVLLSRNGDYGARLFASDIFPYLPNGGEVLQELLSGDESSQRFGARLSEMYQDVNPSEQKIFLESLDKLHGRAKSDMILGLSRSKVPEVIPYLHDFLTSSDTGDNQVALLGLNYFEPDPALLPRIHEIVATQDNRYTVESGAEYMDRLNDPEIVPVLERALDLGENISEYDRIHVQEIIDKHRNQRQGENKESFAETPKPSFKLKRKGKTICKETCKETKLPESYFLKPQSFS